MRPSQEEKLAEARRYFFSYQFRQAYHLYHQSFSTLPFQVTDSHLDHIAHYARTLLELDKLEELRFYLPILEKHYEKGGSSKYTGYALGYIHYFLGSRARSRELMEAVRDRAGADGDLKIKATMILARLAEETSETISLIQSIDFPAQDGHLGKLLEVWRSVILRHQGKAKEAVDSLRQLAERCKDPAEWYCLLAAKDALIRAQLKVNDFDGARAEIEGLHQAPEWGKFRTVVMQMKELNTVYRETLAARTILVTDKKAALELSLGDYSVRVQQEGLRRLIRLFQDTPSLTIRKLTKQLAVGQDELRELSRRLLGKLHELQLPPDSLEWEGIRVHFVPALANHGAVRRYQ